MLVGAHPWVYAATQPGRDITPILDQIFADISWAGFDAIELMHTALLPDDAEARLAALITKHSLRVIGSSFGADMWNPEAHAAILASAEQIVSRLARLGGVTLGTSVGHARTRKSAKQLDAQADLLRQLIGLCEAHGVVLNLHNHTYEVEDGEHDLRGTLARVPDIKLGPDLNWLLRAGVDPVDFLRRHHDRLVFLHLRDQNAGGRWSEALGEGATDYAAIAHTLREIAYSGPAVVELAHERDFTLTRPLRETLRLSREFVRRTFGH